jgi:hypothetical protein
MKAYRIVTMVDVVADAVKKVDEWMPNLHPEEIEDLNLEGLEDLVKENINKYYHKYPIKFANNEGPKVIKRVTKKLWKLLESR